jgi:hypothetical protein
MIVMSTSSRSAKSLGTAQQLIFEAPQNNPTLHVMRSSHESFSRHDAGSNRDQVWRVCDNIDGSTASLSLSWANRELVIFTFLRYLSQHPMVYAFSAEQLYSVT